MLNYALRAISILLTAVYTVFSLQACSSPAPLQQAAAPQEDIPITQDRGVVNILQSRSEISLPLQQAIEQYAAGRDGIQINVQTVSGKTDYQVALRSRLLAGDPVDILQLSSHRDAAELSSYLEDLSSHSWIRNCAEALLDPVTIDGKLYGIPYSVEGIGFIANRKIFEAAGIPLTDIRSFEDMTEAFAELQKQIDEGELEERFPMLEAVTELPALDKDFLSTCLADVALAGLYATPSQVAGVDYLELPHPDATEKFVRLLARYGYAPNWSDYNSVSRNEQVENGLASERIAIILDTTECYSQIRALNEGLENRLALLPVYLEEVESGGVYTGAPLYWAINQSSSPKSKETALAFLSWLYNTDSGGKVLASQFSLLSPYRETAGDTGVALHRQLLAEMESGSTLPQIHRELGNWGGEVFASEIRNYLAGASEWSEVTELSESQWRARR